MKLEILPTGVIRVVLSERNCRALLAKLDIPGSARTITKEDSNGSPPLVLEIERDADHYNGRPPGPMHPATEALLGIPFMEES